MIKGNVLLMVKFAIIVAGKIILNLNANLRSRYNSDRPRGSKSKSHKCGKCGHNKKVDCIEYGQEESGESDSESKGMKDLTDQVHSLFYH